MSANQKRTVNCFSCNKEIKKSPSRVKLRNFCCKACIKGVGVRSRPNAVCHPDRPHLAKGWCSKCYSLNWEKSHKEYRYRNAKIYRQKRPERILITGRKYKYGVTKEQIEKMESGQNGLCVVCKTAKATDLDHNHNTKQIRELLCGSCNRGLGSFRENVEILQNAISYINKWNTTVVAFSS